MQTGIHGGGILLFMPVFHHFNVNDNIIIVSAAVSVITGQIIRALARTSLVFTVSVTVEIFGSLFAGPIRGQMTRCIFPEETGKVFAMLASLECAVPILASMIFTNVYNATSGAEYPWKGTFYFTSSAMMLPGVILTLTVYIMLKGKMVTPPVRPVEVEDPVSLKRLNSSLHPDDFQSRREELFCLSYKNLVNK